MRYALNLADDGHILSATYEEFAPTGAPLVDELPEGDLSDYRFTDGECVYDPLPIPEPPAPSEPDDNTSVWDELDAAYQEGVDSI